MSTTPVDQRVYLGRIERLRQQARDEGWHAVVLVPGANMRYYTGLPQHLYQGTVLALLVVDGESVLFAPGYMEAAATRIGSMDKIVTYSHDESPDSALAGLVSLIESDRLRFALDFRSVNLATLELLQSVAPEMVYEDAGALMARARMAKEHHEVRVIAEAARLLDIGMESGQRAIREAATEVEVHNAIEDALRRLGFSGQMIVCVASGERSDRPHMATSTRTLRPGDVLWIDIAVEHRGYFARIARTFVLGQMSAELAEVYQVVLAAQQALREGANPGMTGAQIQSRAAAIVHKRGFGDHCSHKAGHGIGLELYEQPELVPQADEPLPENTTLCVEAGIYLPAIGGVKIADSVGMFAEGSCSLTRFRRNLSTPKSKYVV